MLTKLLILAILQVHFPKNILLYDHSFLSKLSVVKAFNAGCKEQLSMQVVMNKYFQNDVAQPKDRLLHNSHS